MARMKNWCMGILSLVVLAGCGPADVVVVSEIDILDPETQERIARPVADLRVQLIPFDRDRVFDSLTAAAPTPEPQLPAALAAARDSIAEARRIWTESESAWLAARDRLQEITEETSRFSPAEAQYRLLVQEFDRTQATLTVAERTKDEAFARFDELQRATNAELEQFRATVMLWEDEAFADLDLAISAQVAATGLEIVTDTTDATGRVALRVPPGEWWVYARQPEATDELYWNVPVTLVRGEPTEVRLDRGNAQLRPIY